MTLPKGHGREGFSLRGGVCVFLRRYIIHCLASGSFESHEKILGRVYER